MPNLSQVKRERMMAFQQGFMLLVQMERKNLVPE